MNIILNETEWARTMIERRELGSNQFDTLSRIARYYRQVDGCSRSETQQRLEHFLLRCNPNVNLVLWSDSIDRMASNALKYKLIEIDGIPITKKELETVGAVGSMSAQRLAFTLLVLAKYWNIVHPQNDNWVNTSDKDTLSMADVHTSIKRQCDMFHKLREVGFIQFSKRVDNLNVRVLAVSNDPDDEQVLYITDTRSIGNQYMMYRGQPYFTCEECGIVTRRTGTRQKYCPSCAHEIRIQQSIASVKRQRQARAFAKEMAKNEAV